MYAALSLRSMRQLPPWSSAVIFNAAWFGCVAGGNVIALIVTVAYLLFHHFAFVKSRSEYRVIIGVSFLGIVLDSVITSVGLIEFSQRIEVGSFYLAPLWLVCLWLCFTTTLHHGFNWLHHRLGTAALLAAWSVPSSYFVGARLSGSTVDHVMLMLVIYALLWMLFFPLFLRWAR